MRYPLNKCSDTKSFYYNLSADIGKNNIPERHRDVSDIKKHLQEGLAIKMAEPTSQDDEQARLKSQEEGKQREQELELAKDRARKEGKKEGRELERKKENGGGGSGLKVVVGIIALLIIIFIAALLTLNVTVTNPATGIPMPFSSNYSVTFPEGQQITIGNTHITVLSYQNELISNIDGDQQRLVEGQDRVTAERRAVITTLGAVTLMDIDFQLDLKYKGQRDNLAYFDMVIHTSNQVPDLLLRRLLPSSINASPM